MLYRKFQLMVLSAVITMLASACTGQVFASPTATATETPVPPTATLTFTPTSTSTATPEPSATSTETATPTETSIPGPATLVGKVSYTGQSTRSVTGFVELRQAETFSLLYQTRINGKGGYQIPNIDAGVYEVWVLFSAKPVMVTGCRDVLLPGDDWKLGISFGDKALTMEIGQFSNALLFAEALQGSDLKADGFYAVLSNFKIASGIENTLDITLSCE